MSAPRPIPECGTYAAYQRHGRLGEPRDDACKDAARDYMRTFRADNQRNRIRELEANEAYRRALTRLRAKHRREFEALYLDELPQVRARRRTG